MGSPGRLVPADCCGCPSPRSRRQSYADRGARQGRSVGAPRRAEGGCRSLRRRRGTGRASRRRRRVPDARKHLVRYYDAYSHRRRAFVREKNGAADAVAGTPVAPRAPRAGDAGRAGLAGGGAALGLGAGVEEGLRGGSARLPEVRGRDEGDRVDHGTRGDRPDPCAPKAGGARVAVRGAGAGKAATGLSGATRRHARSWRRPDGAGDGGGPRGGRVDADGGGRRGRERAPRARRARRAPVRELSAITAERPRPLPGRGEGT